LGPAASFFQSSNFVAVGPVEQFDRRAGTLVVLGQTYAIAKSTQFGSHRAQITVGSYVAVAGSVATAAVVTATRVQVLSTSYVDGASLAFVRGQVGTVDESLGRLSIGKLLVDYTPSLGSTDVAMPAVGEFAELSGVKPSSDGVMLAYSSKSIIGSDIQGKSIVGSDIQGTSIIGSDVQAKSIVGSDAR
jgi:hypothetical protein